MNFKHLLVVVLVGLSGCDAEEAVNPVVKTNDPQQLGQTSVVIEGSIDDTGSIRPIRYGFLWGVVSGLNVLNAPGKIDLGSTTSKKLFSIKLETLSANTTYFVRAYVASPDYTRVTYGNEITFKTLP